MPKIPVISLPPIPQGLEPEIKQYLDALTKVLHTKNIDDYSRIEKLQAEVDQLKELINV